MTLFEGNSPVTSDLPSLRASNMDRGVSFVLILDKSLNKQSSRQWFEMPLDLCVIIVVLI